MPRAEYPEGDVRGERMDLVTDSALYLAEHLHEVPVLLIPCLEGRLEQAPAGMATPFWASLFPAAWSFCLALRSRGLGSCWTTFHLLADGEKQAAEILGIRYEKYSHGGLFPIAYTKRLPVDRIVHWDSW